MIFLLGAGFDIDANREAGPVLNSYSGGRIDCGYPLVADVLKLCFGLDALPMGKSVEDLFADASRNRDYEPLKKLVDRLMEADYYIPQKLISSGTSNSYRQFFEKFHGTHFLTFNYDSLPEILLSQKRQWYPEDGYGVPVATELTFGVKPTNAKSSSLVLHLHGSACVYTNDFEIVGNPLGEIAELVPRAEPQYAFDAESMSRCFPRYRRMMSRTGRVGPDERVIAPIPDKSQDLKQVFIRQTYEKALPLVRQAGTLIAVGYSFGDHDRISYDPILEALAQTSERTLFIVSPQAKKLAAKISVEHIGLRVKPIEKTFGEWASDSFRRC